MDGTEMETEKMGSRPQGNENKMDGIEGKRKGMETRTKQRGWKRDENKKARVEIT